jgi:hypothetical protein
MPVLLYCISKRDPPLSAALTGVAGSSVSCAALGELAAVVSRTTDSAVWLKPEVRTSAVQFHAVLKEVFRCVAIIPFRFPTIFDDDTQLEQQLGGRSHEYESLLNKYATAVQMEVSINGTRKRDQISGSEYLRNARESIRAAETCAENIRELVSPIVRDWRKSSSGQSIRLFALVERQQVSDFESKMLHLRVPAGFQVRVTGPWPVGQFIEQS